jgi:uncharacterized membrane protein
MRADGLFKIKKYKHQISPLVVSLSSLYLGLLAKIWLKAEGLLKSKEYKHQNRASVVILNLMN